VSGNQLITQELRPCRRGQIVYVGVAGCLDAEPFRALKRRFDWLPGLP